jgi:CheY-like chemotaxis protein
MVVEDDLAIRESLVELLEEEGYAVLSAPNGREALEMLRRSAPLSLPCLILLDLMMPVMDGWQFRREQRSDPELGKIPVVVITAAGEQQAASIQANLILQKPVRVERVLGAVQRFCC